MMKGVGFTLVQEELSAHIVGEVTAVVAAEGHHEAAQPGQSEVSIWSRDLVSTNPSSPGHPLLHVGVGQLGGVAVDMEQHTARAPVISPHVLDS